MTEYSNEVGSIRHEPVLVTENLGYGRYLRSVPMVVLGLAMMGSLWTPWFRILGSRGSSFRVLDTANLIGLEDFEPLRIFWYLLPVLYISCLILLVLDKPRIAAAFQIVLSVPILAMAVGLLIVGVGAWGAGAATTLSLSSMIYCVVLIVRASIVGTRKSQV